MNPRDRVRRRAAAGDYGEKPLRRYELTAQLAPGGSAAAVFVQWDAKESEYDDTAQSFTLYSLATVKGNVGDRGYCWYASDRGQWEALDAGGASNTVKKVTFVASAALVNQAYLDDCPIVNDWYSNAGVTEINAYNEAGWQCDAGAEGYAEWRPSDQTWVITLLPCPQNSS